MHRARGHDVVNGCGRFAPSCTGKAHPGTLLSALLAWLDARQKNLSFLLRYEDLDPDRCRAYFGIHLSEAMTWLGLDWDQEEKQTDHIQRYEQACDSLADHGVLYACSCSRSAIRAVAERTSDGSYRYPRTCREQLVTKATWRTCPWPLRVCIADDVEMGDPVVRRRDGAFSYQLAVVVDDAEAGVTRIVRGSDIYPSTTTQRALQQLLGYAQPSYQHHFLLLEPDGEKLAKLHQSISWSSLSSSMSAGEVCAFLANCAGIPVESSTCTPKDLLDVFSWDMITCTDQTVLWQDGRLQKI